METRYSKYEPIFGSWYIKDKIGEGSTGEVFLIEREDLGTTYRSALKCITVPQSQDEALSVRSIGMTDLDVKDYYASFMKRINTELVTMAKLKGNSNVVSYEDHMIIPHDDEIGWDILIRMELLTPLLKYSEEHQLDEKDVIRLGIDMCKAMSLCGSIGVIHRDIKPENIFVSNTGSFKLGDFGISRTLEETRIGLSRKGTFTYMAPEVYKGEPYGPRSDIYSLGLVLYKFLNGGRYAFLPGPEEPISYEDNNRAFFKRMSGAVLPPPAYGSEDLQRIVLKACSYLAKDRFTNSDEMRAALEDLAYRTSFDEKTPAEAVHVITPLKGKNERPANERFSDNEGSSNERLADNDRSTNERLADGRSDSDHSDTNRARSVFLYDPFDTEYDPFDTEDEEGPHSVKRKIGKKLLATIIAVAVVAAGIIYAVIPKKVEAVSGIHSNENVYIGDTKTFHYKIQPSWFEEEPISFHSSNEKIMKVTEDGSLKGVAVGDAELTLKVKGYTKNVKVHIVPKVTDIKGIKKKLSLQEGDTYKVKPKLAPAKFANEKISFSSSDRSVITVNKNGKLNAKKSGKASLVVSAGGYSEKIKITVSEPPAAEETPSVYSDQSTGSSDSSGSYDSSVSYSNGSGSSSSSGGSYSSGGSGSSGSSSGSSGSGSGSGSSGSNAGTFDSADDEFF